MLQELHNKIDAKNTLMQSNALNLIKQALLKTMQDTSRMQSKKTSINVDFSLQNLQDSHERKSFLNY